MKLKEFEKKIDATRRVVGKKYGFRQSSYINFKIEQGYFFELLFDSDVRLYVKPMYADDLWWDIFDLEENKKAPVSLRGLGCFSLSGQNLYRIQIYEHVKEIDSVDIDGVVERAFKEASVAICKFLDANPDAESYIPEESCLQDRDKLLRLITLIHNRREEEALTFISSARKQGREPQFTTTCVCASGVHEGMDSYEAIEKWCSRHKEMPKLWDRFKSCLAVLAALCLLAAASCSQGAVDRGAKADSEENIEANEDISKRRQERAEALRRDSVREDSLRRAAELKASEPLHAYEFVGGGYNKDMGRGIYNVYVNKTSLNNKGFVKSGKHSWERKGPDGITKIVEKGEEIDYNVTITFPTSSALKAFIHTFPAADLKRSQYSNDAYSTGGSDWDVCAVINGLSVTFSY